MINKYFALTLVAASVAVASGCSSDDDDDDTTGGGGDEYVSPAATPGEGGSVYDFIVNSDQHESLEAAINAAGLADTLDDETLEFTVFAPDDAAFAALDAENEGTVAALLADTDALTRVLQYHVVEGTVDSAAIGTAIAAATEEAPATLATLIEGESLTATLSETAGAGVAVNGVDVSAADLVPEVAEGEETVGVVHSIVAVLEAPEEVVDGGETDGGETDGGETDGGDTTGGGDADGTVTSSLSANNSGFLTAFSSTFGAQKLDATEDADPWTVFAPTEVADDIDVRNYLITGAALTAQELIDMGTGTTFGGTTLTFGGTADALTINDLPATLVGDGTTASVTYSVEGEL